MLGTEVALRPSEAGLKLDSEEIADISKNAVPHFARQFPVRIADAKRGTERYRLFHLQASARQGNILEIGHAPARAPAGVLPLDVHQVRAKHPGFNTPLHHIYTLIGVLPAIEYAST